MQSFDFFKKLPQKIGGIIFLAVFWVLGKNVLFAHGGGYNSEGLANASDGLTAAGTDSLLSVEQLSFFNISNWYFDPTLILIFGLAFCYTNYLIKSETKKDLQFYIRVSCFYCGGLVLVISLSSPVDLLSDYSFMGHMVQHLGLTLIGAPLIVLGRPFPYAMRGVPVWARDRLVIPLSKNKVFRKILGFFMRPYIAAAAYVFNMWLWHYPFLYDLALGNELFHLLQHFLFFYTATMVWWNIFPHPGQNTSFGVAKIPYMIVTVLFDNLLGAILTLAETSFYDFKNPAVLGLSVVEHQRIGGATMWVVGMFVHLIVMGVLFSISVRNERVKAEIGA